MPAYLERPTPDLWILRVRGVLKKSELDALQTRLAGKIDEENAEFKTLVILEAFEGWESGGNWEESGFFYTHGDRITKIAFVGDQRWEIPAMAFVGAGIRKAPVRFFPPHAEAEAREWLKS